MTEPKQAVKMSWKTNTASATLTPDAQHTFEQPEFTGSPFLHPVDLCLIYCCSRFQFRLGYVSDHVGTGPRSTGEEPCAGSGASTSDGNARFERSG